MKLEHHGNPYKKNGGNKRSSSSSSNKKSGKAPLHINQESLDALGEHLEDLLNKGGPSAVEKFCREYTFQGPMEGMKFIGGTGCNRIALGNDRLILKVVREPRAVYQNKFEVWIMRNVKNEDFAKHIPDLIAFSKNYHVTVTRRLAFSLGEDNGKFQAMLKDPDFKMFKELGLGDDIYNNNSWWDAERNTWIIVDLGIPSSSKFCQGAIQNLKNGRNIRHGLKLDHNDMCK